MDLRLDSMKMFITKAEFNLSDFMVDHLMHLICYPLAIICVVMCACILKNKNTGEEEHTQRGFSLMTAAAVVALLPSVFVVTNRYDGYGSSVTSALMAGIFMMVIMVCILTAFIFIMMGIKFHKEGRNGCSAGCFSMIAFALIPIFIIFAKNDYIWDIMHDFVTDSIFAIIALVIIIVIIFITLF